MQGRFSDWLLCLSISFFLFFFQNSFFFPPTKFVLEKWRSWTHLSLDRREIWAPRSQPNSEHSHRWEFWHHVWAERNTFRIVAFSFPAETQNGLNKTTIPILLIFMKFWYVVRDLVRHTFTVGICEIIFTEREKEIAPRQYKWRL